MAYPRIQALIICLILALGARLAAADIPIADPIADYLAMNVPDRIANSGGIWIIKKVEVDVDGDGKPEVFVGTWYRRSGPNTWLWTGYTQVPGGFRRITPEHSDVLIDFDNIFVGEIPALNRQGMAQAYSLELDNKNRDQSNMISDLEYYFIENGLLVQQSAGPLDRDDPEQLAVFEALFGPNRKQREVPRIESYSVGQLAAKGYKIPNWNRPQQ
jgi:hypothetical protein